MSKQHKIEGELRSTRHTSNQQEPHRVASRLEGIVKNKGVESKKKQPKQKH